MSSQRSPVLEPGWLLTPAARPYLGSILHRTRRRVFGLLERPALPPHLAVPLVPYKLFLHGKSGVGKTALVASLAGTHVPPVHHETLGIEVTTVYWPAKARASGRPVMFQLRFWDCGDGAMRKFEHLLPVRLWVWCGGGTHHVWGSQDAPPMVPSPSPGLQGGGGRRPLPVLLHRPRVLRGAAGADEPGDGSRWRGARPGGRGHQVSFSGGGGGVSLWGAGLYPGASHRVVHQ
uniref:Ciliogenesis and planar polarity effector 2 n=1 Tax=Amazona collaria TaxID=241587 RepID=A0A8B9F278_9PSIT